MSSLAFRAESVLEIIKEQAVRRVGCGIRHDLGGRRWIFLEQLTSTFDLLSAVSIGEKTEATNPHEAFRQNM